MKIIDKVQREIIDNYCVISEEYETEGEAHKSIVKRPLIEHLTIKLNNFLQMI
jgi:hypothetical protein